MCNIPPATNPREGKIVKGLDEMININLHRK